MGHSLGQDGIFGDGSEYNFNTEGFILSVLGGYVELTKPTPLFILCKMYNISMHILYIFLILMSSVTIYMQVKTGERSNLIETANMASYMLVGISFTMLRTYSVDAVRLITNGVYRYLEEQPDEEYYNRIKSRVDQKKVWASTFFKLCIASVFAYCSIIPVLKYFTVKGDTPDKLVNPYLPLPIYMPFETRTISGYCTAYTCQALYLFRFHMTLSFVLELYISCTLQLMTEIELFNYFLRNIENRAIKKMAIKHPMFQNINNFSSIYEIPYFQNCIYTCLRESIIHHQEILR